MVHRSHREPQLKKLRGYIFPATAGRRQRPLSIDLGASTIGPSSANCGHKAATPRAGAQRCSQTQGGRALASKIVHGRWPRP
jgi:hypothetical protein